MTVLQLLRRHPRYLTFGFLHFFFSFVGQTFFISLFVDDMTEQLGWPERRFATLYSTVTLIAAFTLPVMGTLVDRVRLRYVSTAVAITVIGALYVMGAATSVYLLFPALFLIRLGGQGVLPLIGSTAIGRYFVEGRGKALSASIIGISAAEVILPPLAVALLGTGDYSVTWWAAAALVLLVFLPAIWLLVSRYDNFQRAETVATELKAAAPEAATVRCWTRAEVLADSRFWFLLPALVFIPFLFTGFVFNQSLIGEARSYSASWMALGLSTYGGARLVWLLFAGGIADRFGAARVLRWVYLPVLLAIAAMIFIDARPAVPLFFGLAGTTAGVESVLWPALWAERYGPLHLGGIKSMVRVFVVVASAAAPVVFSYGLGWGVENWLGGMLGYGVLAWGLVQVGARARVRG